MVALRAATAYATGNTTEGGFSISVPSGVQDGDVMYLAIFLTASSGSINAPSGWVPIYENSEPGSSTSSHASLYRRVASSEPASYAVSGTTGRWSATMVALTGVDNTTPEDDTGVAVDSSAGISAIAPSVTASAATWLLTFHGGRTLPNGAEGTWAQAGTMTEINDVCSAYTGSNSSHDACYEAVGSGATGTRTSTAEDPFTSVDWIAYAVVVTPASGGETPKSGSDTGSGAEGAPTLVVAASGSDAGSGADVSSLDTGATPKSGSDTGSGTEAVTARAIGAADAGTSSEGSTLGANIKPNAPTPLVPTGTITDPTPTLQATFTDPNGDSTAKIQWQVSTSSLFGTTIIDTGLASQVVANGGTGWYTCADLSAYDGQTLYWRARAQDPGGLTGDYCAATSFHLSLPSGTGREVLVGASHIEQAVDRRSFRLGQRGAGGLQTLTFSVRAWDLGATTIEDEDTLSYLEDAALIYKGIVRRVVRRLDATDRLWLDIACQDLSSLAGDDGIYDDTASPPGPIVRTVDESDAQRIAWLFSTFGTHGITVGSEVATLLASFPLDENGDPSMDFTGMTLAEAMDAICRVTGGGWYVDAQYQLHYFAAENLTAPWTLSDQPDDSTSFGYSQLMLPSDTIDMRNRCVVIGTGYMDVFDETTSQTLYGVVRTGVLKDPTVTNSAQAEAAANAWFAAHAWAKIDGSLRTRKVGLRPGMLVTIQHSAIGLDSQFIVQETNLTLEPTRPVVDVRFGDAPLTLGSIVSGVSSQAGAAFTRAEQAVAAANPDTTPPPVPTGLGVQTGLHQAADGSLVPYLQVSWVPVSASDLEAYEVEIDRALSAVPAFAATASGTGGSLPAGVYYVRVTAVGAVGGETPGDIQTVSLTAGQRLYVNVTAMTGADSYNVYASRATEPLYALNTSTTGSNVEVVTEGSGGTAPTTSDATSFIDPLPLRTSQTAVMTEAVQGGVWYAARVRAIDTSGNRSNFTAIQGVTVEPDTTAPEIPTGLTAAGGFRLLGLRWNRNTEPDLDRYGVRYAPEDSGNPGNPDPDQWAYLQTRATSIVLMGLEPDTLYFAEVRAIDRSGHCVTSDVDSTAVDADANLDAGWSDWATATPSLVGAADVSFNSVITSILAANEISADDIKAGTLEIGGKPNVPDFLIVYDGSGVEIGRWDQYGLIVTDPTNTDRQVRVRDGTISFSVDGGASWETAIGPEGVIADSIRLGIAPGGHNALPNSSFELSAFATTLLTIWTSSTDWGGGLSQVNVNVATGDLYIGTPGF